MPRARRPRQLDFTFRTRGGARSGAGRPPTAARAGVSHLVRPALSRHHPVHVTLRVGPGIESLRGSSMFRAVRGALAAARDRFGFRLVHFSVQRNHLHLLVEASDRRSLTRGAQGLSIRVAKAVNRRLGRRGKVFADRYHARALKTPRETRWALRYVLLNVRKHARGGVHSTRIASGAANAVRGGSSWDPAELPAGFVDGCSSAPWFDGWTRPSQLAFVAGNAARTRESPVMAPRTWLLRLGFKRPGPLDCDDAPFSGLAVG